MPTSFADRMHTIIDQFQAAVESKKDTWLQITDPAEFMSAEQDIAALSRAAADDLTAAVLQARCDDAAFAGRCVTSAVSTGAYRSNGSRTVSVTFLGGNSRDVCTRYTPAARNGRHRRPRPGLLPVLSALGVMWNTTPALSDEVCRSVTEASSLRDGIDALDRRGIRLEYKRTLRLVQRTGALSTAARAAWVEQMLEGPPVRGELRGRTVLVSVDGGRLRERRRRRGRRRKSGHHGFDAPWKEPRQLVIEVLDEEGRVDPRFRPVYDATLGDADALFDLLQAHLRSLGAHEARTLVFAADGAEWIWNRVGAMAQRLGLQGEVVQVVDFSHAVGTLHTVAKACRNWSDAHRRRWVSSVEGLLYRGKIDAVVDAIRDVAKGRRAKAVLSHVGYFAGNAQRMQYDDLRRRNLPQGSGAVESAVRRVINLRLKSAGKFWLKPNAKAMLHMRSVLKAGHWDHMFRRLLTKSIPWNDCPLDPPTLRKDS